jgi:hypothetical protein
VFRLFCLLLCLMTVSELPRVHSAEGRMVTSGRFVFMGNEMFCDFVFMILY